MEEDAIDISPLIEKYEHCRVLGKKIYLDADEFAALSEYYHTEGDEEEANVLIDEGLKMHPNSLVLMMLRARSFLFVQQYNETLNYLEGISDTTSIEVALMRIESLLHLKRNNEAEEIISQITSENQLPEDYHFFITHLGYILIDTDFFARAVSCLEESIKYDDSDFEALAELTYAYELNEQIDKAIDTNNLLLDVNPYAYEWWINLGKLHTYYAENDKALEAFEFALAIEDQDLVAMKMKAMSLFLSDNFEDAIDVYEDVLEKSPKDEDVYESLLEAYSVVERHDKMMEVIDKREFVFGGEGIIAQRVLVHLCKQDYDTAKKLFAQIPESEKGTFDYFMLEGELAFYEGDLSSAENAFMKASLISEENDVLLDKLANVSVAQEKFEQAAGYLEELLSLSPNFPSAKSRLAYVRFEIGSKEPFDELIEQFSDDELKELLLVITGREKIDFSVYTREKILIRLNEARENRVLFKNIKF